MKRYNCVTQGIPYDSYGDMEQDEDGDYVLFSDASSLLTASEARVRTLEAALQHEIDNCVNCEGKSRYVTHREGGYEFTVSCERCAPARSALRDVTATKGEARDK